jgi:hypothetical protein
MSVGLGIFLSSVVFALVMLYGITKDRWHWPEIARISAATVVLTGVIIGGLNFWKQLPAIPGPPPTVYPQTEYASIRLGMGPDKVYYIKGSPTAVHEEEMEGPYKGSYSIIEPKDLEKGKDVFDYQTWRYQGYQYRIEVAFNAEKTAVVAIKCYSSFPERRCPPIAGVTDGDSEQEVIQKLGEPGTSRTTGVAKFMSYQNLGIELWLDEQARVYMFGIYDPKYPRGD